MTIVVVLWILYTFTSDKCTAVTFTPQTYGSQCKSPLSVSALCWKFMVAQAVSVSSWPLCRLLPRCNSSFAAANQCVAARTRLWAPNHKPQYAERPAISLQDGANQGIWHTYSHSDAFPPDLHGEWTTDATWRDQSRSSLRQSQACGKFLTVSKCCFMLGSNAIL